MANANLTPTIITRTALDILHNNLAFAKNVNRQYDDRFASSGGKIGDSLQIRLPNKYSVRTGKTLDAQDNIEPQGTLTVATQVGVDLNFSTAELTLEIEDFADRILEPACARLASEIDSTLLAQFFRVNNRVGTAGTTPASALVWLQGGQKLDENATPRDGLRNICMDPGACAATVNGLSGLFQSAEKIKAQYEKGMMGQALGFDWYMDQNIPSLTTGTRVGTILVDGTSSATSWTGGDWTALTGTIHIDGLTNATDTVKQGETFTVGSVYALNPETGVSTGSLQIFTVLADATAAGNEVDLSVWPPLITTGPYATIDALPTDGAAVTFYGSASTAYKQNIAYHRDAFVLATADLEDVSQYGAWGARREMDGISMRVARQYDINNDNVPCRLDVLFGVKVIRPEMACRVSA